MRREYKVHDVRINPHPLDSRSPKGLTRSLRSLAVSCLREANQRIFIGESWRPHTPAYVRRIRFLQLSLSVQCFRFVFGSRRSVPYQAGAPRKCCQFIPRHFRGGAVRLNSGNILRLANIRERKLFSLRRSSWRSCKAPITETIRTPNTKTIATTETASSFATAMAVRIRVMAVTR